jgi:putative endonuclease
MPQNRRRACGELGERIAKRHLERRGYRVLERNFRTRYGEIDLIAVDSRAIVFCEVKTRVAGGGSGPDGPLDAIGRLKRRQVRLIAAQWFSARGADPDRPRRPELRFDAIGVTVEPDGRLVSLEHLEGAF